METAYARLCRLERLDREHRRAIYQWHHPANLQWAARRGTADRHEAIRQWCRRLANRVAELEAAKRQHVADVAKQPPAEADRSKGEPPVIRRRGEGGKPHAK